MKIPRTPRRPLPALLLLSAIPLASGCGRSDLDDLEYPASDGLGSNTVASCGAGAGVSVLVASVNNTSAAPNLADVHADANSVYWAGTDTSGAPVVLRVPSCGGSTDVLARAAGTSIGGTAIDGENVYWTDSDVGSVMQTPLTGGASLTLVSGQTRPLGVAVDGAYVYWTSSGPSFGGSAFGAVSRVPLGGEGPAENLITVDGDPTEIAVDAENVYWVDAENSSLVSLPLAGGFPSTLASLDHGAFTHVAVTDGSLYWSTADTIASLKVGSGAAVTLVSSPGASFTGVAADSSYAYWTDGAAGTVSRIALGGAGATDSLAAGQTPLAVTAYGGTVFWTNDDSVASVTPK